jgi:hypothetical protein
MDLFYCTCNYKFISFIAGILNVKLALYKELWHWKFQRLKWRI